MNIKQSEHAAGVQKTSIFLCGHIEKNIIISARKQTLKMCHLKRTGTIIPIGKSLSYTIVGHSCCKSEITMPAVCLMLKGNHIKIIIIEHQSVRLSFSIINLRGFLPKRNHIKISFENISYHLSSE